ncbi:ArsR family transcriptional regulator [Haloferax sp. MBLA0076]|uniref:ArsR family transcriptional regulator n=1 Tax=Haloferax litoreum TaxID=2666140 RepID=A0A6A8GIS7_9EURY|nr:MULTISPECIES: helix-turn-helix domain-containing protein [Haloferax]KAB1193522.1 helix-turn-helix transcriptional regulator [Haloferax sp. CBA1148]MRX22037.1 ArsR family transcriptional regulator [Haloferax litoreum]
MAVHISRGAGTGPEAAFAALGHQTRLGILHELWKEREPTEHIPQQTLSFAELRRRVGVKDGSQFNYHLKQLLDEFVHRTEDGYVITRAGERTMRTVLAESFGGDVVFDSEPVDDPCPLCGGQVVLEYGTERTLDFLAVRCTACEGAFQTVGMPRGCLSATEFLPPTGLRHRSLKQVYEAQQIWINHKFQTMMEGVCPECTGTVSITPSICESHDAPDGHVCSTCHTIFPIRFHHICDICHMNFEIPCESQMFTHPSAEAFYHERGHDDVWGHDWLTVSKTILERRVASEDPLEIRVSAAVDGDRIDVTIDETGRVVDLHIDAV